MPDLVLWRKDFWPSVMRWNKGAPGSGRYEPAFAIPQAVSFARDQS